VGIAENSAKKKVINPKKEDRSVSPTQSKVIPPKKPRANIVKNEEIEESKGHQNKIKKNEAKEAITDKTEESLQIEEISSATDSKQAATRYRF